MSPIARPPPLMPPRLPQEYPEEDRAAARRSLIGMPRRDHLPTARQPRHDRHQPALLQALANHVVGQQRDAEAGVTGGELRAPVPEQKLPPRGDRHIGTVLVDQPPSPLARSGATQQAMQAQGAGLTRDTLLIEIIAGRDQRLAGGADNAGGQRASFRGGDRQRDVPAIVSIQVRIVILGAEVEPHRRHRVQETTDARHHNVVDKLGLRQNAQRFAIGAGTLHGPRDQVGARGLIEDLPRAVVVHPTLVGRGHLPRRAFEKRQPKAPFERCHLLRHRAFRQAERFSGAAEATLFHHLGERPHLTESIHRALSLAARSSR